jgi:hypothetical protein
MSIRMVTTLVLILEIFHCPTSFDVKNRLIQYHSLIKIFGGKKHIQCNPKIIYIDCQMGSDLI